MNASRLLLALLLVSCSGPSQEQRPPSTTAGTAASVVPSLIDAGVDQADASAATADAAATAEVAPPATPLTKPCASGSPELDDALEKHAKLKNAIERLQPTSDPTVAAERLGELLEHPCLALARSLGNTPGKPPQNAPALIEFWLDGGRRWIAAELDRATLRTHVLAPPFRSVLDRESNANHRLGPLLCKTKDAACVAETAGWARRTNRVLAGRDIAGRNPSPDHSELVARCEKEAEDAPPATQLQMWHACLESSRPSTRSLPLWLPRSPSKGWLVIRGRRGHYSFCDEVRMFNVATGDAYSIQSCSGLALTSSGGVDPDRTDASRKRRFRRGRVNVENLRETLWLLLLIPEVERLKQSLTFNVPEGIDLSVPEGGIIGGVLGGVFGGSSAQTTLFWRYLDGNTSEIAGTVRWPSDFNNVAATYATELLRIVEDGFVDGCPKKRPPRIASSSKSSGVSGLDADPARLELLQSALLADLRKQAKSRCKRR